MTKGVLGGATAHVLGGATAHAAVHGLVGMCHVSLCLIFLLSVERCHHTCSPMTCILNALCVYSMIKG